jgi:RNA polymerase sigma-70 factor (ECF subfamily)
VSVQFCGDPVDPDGALVARAQRGDDAAFSELVQRHASRLLNMVSHLVGSREDAEDLVQETFVQAYRGLGTYQGRSQFFTWLYRIATNRAISTHRKRRLETVQRREALVWEQQPGRERSDPGTAVIEAEETQRVQHAIARLPEDRRAVLVLRDIDGLDYAEIAEILQLPAGTVRSRLHRARLELRELLLSSRDAEGER